MKDFKESIHDICNYAKHMYGFKCLITENFITPDEEIHDFLITVINPNVIDDEWRKLGDIEDRFIDLQLDHGRSILVCLQDRKNVEKFLPEHLNRGSMVMEAAVPAGASPSATIYRSDLFRHLVQRSYADPYNVGSSMQIFTHGVGNIPNHRSIDLSGFPWGISVTFEEHSFPAVLDPRQTQDQMAIPLPTNDESRAALLPLAA